jgi:predicted Zn-dependent protease
MRRLRYLGHKWGVMAMLVLGRSADAMDRLHLLLVDFPGDEYALASIAHLHAQAGDRATALEAYRGLLGAHGGNGVHWFNAESAFRRATELSPQLDRAWYGLGLVLIRLNRLDEAVAALKRNTQLQPMSPYGWYQLARVHVDRHDPEEARKIIRHLKRFEPKVAAQLERETGLLVEPAG